MIRRNTLVLVVVFIVLLGAILYINQDSNLQVKIGMQTATPTPQPKLITGFDFSSLNAVEIHSKNGPNYKIASNEKGEWFSENKEAVSMSTLFQSTQLLMELGGSGSLSQSLPLDQIGLNSPQAQILLTDIKGNHGTLSIGNPTATHSDYYVKWENGPVTIVSSNQIDTLMGNFSPGTLLAPTPAPGITQTP
jgi:hypothetical protein